MIFVDEAGFYVLPSVVRTWAPQGQTPVLKAPLLWEHLSVIGGITPQGKFYQQVYEHSISGSEVVRFLRHLLVQVEGKVTVVWDGLPAHRGKKVKRFLQQGAARRLHLEQLPGYAPDLNPTQKFLREGIWHYLKNVGMKNLCCRHLDMRRSELRKAKERLRHKTEVIKACFRQVGLL